MTATNSQKANVRSPVTSLHKAAMQCCGMWRAGLLWKGFETYSQVSLRNIFLVGLDWVRTKLFGRDISRV